MELKKFEPSISLQPYVRNYWQFSIQNEDLPVSQLLFPFGFFELIINLEGAPEMIHEGKTFIQPDCLYPGQFTKPFLLNFTRRTTCIGISLHPWMGKLFFDIPANNFTDQVANVLNIDTRFSLRERLLESKNEKELLFHLENFLAGKLKIFGTDAIVASIVKEIYQSPDLIDTRSIFSATGMTKRRIEQRFLESAGLPVGSFIRKVRFQKAVNLLRRKNKTSLTHIGLDAGYYDQSHFIREFKEFAMITPAHFLKNRSQIQNFVSELML